MDRLRTAVRGVYERPRADGPSVFQVMFRINGRQTGETFATLADAAEFKELVDRVGGAAARRIRDARDGHGRESAVPTLAEWFGTWNASRTAVTDGTVAEDRRLASRSWMPAFGSWPVDTITRDDITAWIQKRRNYTTKRGERIKSKTIRNEHGLLSTVLAASVPKWRTDNPARGITIADDVREEMVFLADAEFYILLGYVPEYWRPLVVTLASTGMRWGEATALRWSDVHLALEPPRLTVTRAWKRGATTRVIGVPKTKRSRRTISLPPVAVATLTPLQDSPDELVFRGVRGGRVHHQNFHRRIWRVAVETANNPGDGDAARITKRPRIHDLRHSHASWLINQGVDVFKVSRRLGHESVQTTVDVYGHLSPDHLEVTAAAAQAALGLVPEPAAIGETDTIHEAEIVEVDEVET